MEWTDSVYADVKKQVKSILKLAEEKDSLQKVEETDNSEQVRRLDPDQRSHRCLTRALALLRHMKHRLVVMSTTWSLTARFLWSPPARVI